MSMDPSDSKFVLQGYLMDDTMSQFIALFQAEIGGLPTEGEVHEFIFGTELEREAVLASAKQRIAENREV